MWRLLAGYQKLNTLAPKMQDGEVGRLGGSDVFTVVCDVAEIQASLGMA